MLNLIANKTWAVSVEVAEVLRRLAEAPPERLVALAQRDLQAAGGSRRIVERLGGPVAVIPLLGFIQQRGGMFMDFFGGTSTQALSAELRQAAADNSVRGIVLEVDSPGGEVSGVTEAASVIREVRAKKPVVAVASTLAASAAYWLASQADEVLVSPGGEVGSIGVYGIHVDLSAALEKEGVKATLVSAGKYKVEGNPFEPLGEDARAAMQEAVDRYYGMFVADVAKGRRASATAVRGGFGEGRVVGAKQAVELGMADGIGTLDDALRRAGSIGLARRSATASVMEMEAHRQRRERG